MSFECMDGVVCSAECVGRMERVCSGAGQDGEVEHG